MSFSRNPKNTDEIPQPPANGEIQQPTDSTSQTFTDIERIIAHAAEVKFINNRYTTPITVEFGSSESENSVNLPVKHRKIFLAIKLLDPSASITIKDKVITNPKEFPMGTEYTEYFDVITDKKTKFPRFFVHHEIHSTLTVSAMKYSDHNIMSTLQSLRTWVTFNKFDTHRVASIGFLKYISTGLTLHSTAKQRVINALMNVKLNDDDISALQECNSIISEDASNNKRLPDGNRKEPTKPDKTIVFPAFDLSTKRVGFGNGNSRVTTVAYEIRCHPAHATLLKSILIQASVLDPIAPSDNHIHFIPYGLLQTTDANTVKNQIIQQNRFLANTGIVPILNISPAIMQSGLKDRLLALTSVIGLEPTYLTTKSGKWLVIVKKARKDQARQEIDQVINDTIFPDSQIDKPGRSNRHNINSILVSYAAALQKEATPTTIQFHNPPQHTVKRHIRASYDVDNPKTFPTIGNKKGKTNNTTNDTHSTTTNTTTSISNEDSTNVSNFSHDDFLKMLDKNNQSFKKELESSFKNEVAEQLRLNNLAITENFNQRFSSFQTVMLQTIKDVVLQMIPNIPQQQQQMQPPSFHDAFPTQHMLPTSFPSQSVHQTQPHTSPFQSNSQYQQPSPNIQQPSSPLNIPSPSTQSFVPPQSFNDNASSSQQLPPPLENQITNHSESQNSQTSFDKTISALDSDL